jgi:RNA polymerase sigma-70 factor (ECF subfamily)
MNANAQHVRDEWLALRCQAGEPEAFAELVQTMERPLLYFAQKLVNDECKALDVLQEVWLHAFLNIKRLEEPRHIRAWLYRQTHGLAIDRIRKDVASERREQQHAEFRAEATEDPSFDEEDAAEVHAALNKLDIRQREVLVLHFLEDMSLAEIGGILDCPEGTVKSRLHYAKKALHSLLRGQNNEQH